MCNPHLDTLVVSVFIFQTSCYKLKKKTAQLRVDGLGLAAAVKCGSGDSHATHGLAPWFPKAALLLPPPPPHPFTSSNLTASCDSGGLRSFPQQTNPQCRGAIHSCPLTCGFVEAGPRSGHRVCLFLSDLPRFTAQQDDSPSSFPKVISIAPDRLDRKWGLMGFYLLLKSEKKVASDPGQIMGIVF